MRNISLLFVTICAILFSSCSKNSDNSIYSYKLLAVKSEEKWGYIDLAGKYVINPQFKDAYLFSDNIALVKSQDDKYGYIGEDGKYIINPTYKNATVFSDGLAFVTPENGFPTCIDKTGDTKFVLKEAEMACVFKEGLAAIQVKDKWGWVDKTGKIVVNPQFDGINDFSDGLAPFGNRKTKEAEELEWGYIDKEGKIVINAQFKRTYKFAEGKALVSDGKKYGFIDKKGLYVINPQFDDAESFSDGLAAIKQGATWGFINDQGKIVINPQFEEVSSFKNGLAAVRTGKENWGYIDKEGKFVINPQFKAASRFYSDLAPVLSGDKIGFIDKEGKFTVNPQFSDVFTYSDWAKGFSEWYGRDVAESDYFDTNPIIEKLMEKSNDNKHTFSFVNSQTTLSNLVDMDVNKGKLKKNDRYSAINKEEEKLSNTIELKETIYEFDRSLTRQVYSFFSSSEQLDYTAQIVGVTYKLEINRYSKEFGKAEMLAEAFQKYLLKKYSGSDKSKENRVTDNRSDKEKMEDLAKRTADSIAAVLTEEAEASGNSITEKNEKEYLSKTFYVYTKHYNFSIICAKGNRVTIKVYFNGQPNS